MRRGWILLLLLAALALPVSAADVLEQEPPAEDDPLLSAPRSIITPHIAWMTDGARRNIVSITLENIRRFREGRPQNVVNLAWLKPSM